MKTHKLNVNTYDLDAKLKGKMRFAIQEDKGFVVGDHVEYTKRTDNRISTYWFEITYISDYKQKSGYVVFAEEFVSAIHSPAPLLAVAS